ncbi:MAG TPA: DUF4214 domain-containing protein, partial [Pirellulales bacterium]|nr:DUF4214 domain-containing protein [Pirellulales bacterium]
INLTAEGSGSAVELPALTSFIGPKASVTVGQDGAVVLGAQTLTMPASGSGATISVPQLPFAVMINLDSTGTFSGGTTFDIGSGDSVNLIGGTYAGGVTLNVPAGAIVDLTGGNLVHYSGTLAASGAGTVQLASGGVVAGPAGLTLDFPAGMFNWTGGEFFPANGQVTNGGSLEIAGGLARKFAGDFINSGALTVDAGGVLAVGGNFTQTPSGALTLQVAGAPASKQFGTLTVQNSASLDGSLGATLTGNFVPQDNEDFQAITFASSSGDFAAVGGLGPDFRERLQPTSLDLLTSSHDTIDSPVGFTLHATEAAAANGVVASFADANPVAEPGDFIATIEWGDGTTSSGDIAAAANGGGFEVSGSHVYAEGGTHSISVQINNLGGASATVASKAVVAEASVTGDGATLTATQNAPLADAVVATFTHGVGNEKAVEFSATIDWGDGRSSAGTVTELHGTYTVAGSHTYAQSGSFITKTTISDDGVPTVLSGSVMVASVGTPHEQYVTAVYEDVLGRAPDATGLTYWSKRLDQGAAISSVAESIAHSDEYYANFVIKPDYLKLLRRAADDAAVVHWTSLMHGGLTDQQLEADLVSSQEFFENAGGTNPGWVDSVYQLLLGRAASSADESYWNGQLSGGQTLSKVARRIAESQENNTQLINDDYFHYLGRAADAGGLAYWLKQFAAGKTNEDVISGFTGSAEYYKEHTS